LVHGDKFRIFLLKYHSRAMCCLVSHSDQQQIAFWYRYKWIYRNK